MGQRTFADVDYESKKRKTRREVFLERMDRLIPVGGVGGPHPAVLSEGGTRAPSVRVVGDAEDPLRAAVLQSERPGHGGHALRG